MSNFFQAVLAIHPKHSSLLSSFYLPLPSSIHLSIPPSPPPCAPTSHPPSLLPPTIPPSASLPANLYQLQENLEAPALISYYEQIRGAHLRHCDSRVRGRGEDPCLGRMHVCSSIPLRFPSLGMSIVAFPERDIMGWGVNNAPSRSSSS